MSMQGELERTGDIGVLRLSGFVGENVAAPLAVAVDQSGARPRPALTRALSRRC
ncbi:hypothetical protein [Kitasatospora sp. NPDC050463]|uniref:hypothetical protein n=1 Tax=Kitasatospora sp. NPDC050463 TaxID=3155786 RepID=UPI0033F5855B